MVSYQLFLYRHAWAEVVSWCRNQFPVHHFSGCVHRTSFHRHHRLSVEKCWVAFYPCEIKSWCTVPPPPPPMARDVRVFPLEQICHHFLRHVDAELSSALKTVALFQDHACKPMVLSSEMNFKRNCGSPEYFLKAFTCIPCLFLSSWHTHLVVVCYMFIFCTQYFGIFRMRYQHHLSACERWDICSFEQVSYHISSV